ncbi:MAG: VWA domain-containing protein [Acidobacteria bacterium]|nr:VWA domain-containing protein [Acidobacteriota bacterium]
MLLAGGLLAALAATGAVAGALWAQQPSGQAPVFRVKVDLVVLSVSVTSRQGRYVTGLKPGDFRVLEDGIAQKIAFFGEGSQAPVTVEEGRAAAGAEGSGSPGAAGVNLASDSFVGTNVFILFDTSNFMYRGFVYAEDAIADFLRGLDRADSIAIYTFSRNLSRATPPTRDRMLALRGLRQSVAGDDTALYNALLLTLRDAAQMPGRKVVIVFSNGPDNASMLAPDDVRAVAEDEGIPIYVISTSEVNKDPISGNVFRRITARTGGRAYFAKTWQRQTEAFQAIREELGHVYTVSYYPQPNPNEGWRSITVELTGDAAKKYRIRTRAGYRPKL